ncbi:Phosphatase and actin regulator 4 [Eumeta japonica]|uniref:Phosphatase and actin regulator 4 n=1 Tax=Eumeta variegata TaxID=151549 RepID=A0A4C1X620_EUMVA|nr:Phosphatase and actin regulator 4 [Eumeta japonica]
MSAVNVDATSEASAPGMLFADLGATRNASHLTFPNGGRQPGVDGACARIHLDRHGHKLTVKGVIAIDWSKVTSICLLVGPKKQNGNAVRTNSLGSGARTPPVERTKSKFSAFGRLFKPWKWKRKKKSDKFEAASRTLERKISVRANRDELVQKGILLPESPVAPLPEAGSPRPQQSKIVSNSRSAPIPLPFCKPLWLGRIPRPRALVCWGLRYGCVAS